MWLQASLLCGAMLLVPSLSESRILRVERNGSSPPLEATGGKATLPWFAIFFQGRYKIRILALDANAFDYVRSIARADGGFSFGGAPGDRFERPVFHVQGGIGLFGSASADSVGFFVHPRTASETPR